ncbi:MAG: DoxX family protein [Corynebacterium sp.]|uniref:DoxX family protein n=1 Tax=Corynebacterium sp. TaxID=1720 RepID=UPI0026DD4A20|nr:DoxX family protein [Corynebacterium sp.]MDO5029716.1 DoxX family protein [Corynebacterium sp.]
MPSAYRDIIGLLARLSIGAVLIAHGYQKLFDYGMTAAGQSFADMGVPAPELAAWVAALIEFVGGILLFIGLFQPIAGILVTLNMLGAVFLVHISNGVFADNNGFELPLTIAAGAALISAFGSGRFALDTVVGKTNKAAINP